MSIAIAQAFPDGALVMCDGLWKPIQGNAAPFQTSVQRVFELAPTIYAGYLGIKETMLPAVAETRSRDLDGLGLQELKAEIESALFASWKRWTKANAAILPEGNRNLTSGFAIGGYAPEPLVMRVACYRDPVTGEDILSETLIGTNPGARVAVGITDEMHAALGKHLDATAGARMWSPAGPENSYISRFIQTCISEIRNLSKENDIYGGRISWAIVRRGFGVATGADEQ